MIIKILTENCFIFLTQAKRSLKNILQKCTHLPALEPLLHDAPPNILKHVVGQFAKVLPHDSKARRVFVTTGGWKYRKLRQILLQHFMNILPQSMVATPKKLSGTCFLNISSFTFDHDNKIALFFSADRYYSPGYSEQLLERVEQYQPVI